MFRYPGQVLNKQTICASGSCLSLFQTKPKSSLLLILFSIPSIASNLVWVAATLQLLLDPSLDLCAVSEHGTSQNGHKMKTYIDTIRHCFL